MQSLGYVLTGQQMTMHTANCLARMSGSTGQSDLVHHFVRFVTMVMSIYNNMQNNNEYLHFTSWQKMNKKIKYSLVSPTLQKYNRGVQWGLN